MTVLSGHVIQWPHSKQAAPQQLKSIQFSQTGVITSVEYYPLVPQPSVLAKFVVAMTPMTNIMTFSRPQ